MALYFATGFENGYVDLGNWNPSNADYNYWGAKAGSPEASSSIYASGGYSLRINNSGVEWVALRMNDGGSRRRLVGQLKFRYTTLPDSDCDLFSIDGVTTQNIASVYVASGVLRGGLIAGLVNQSWGSISTGVWYLLDFDIDISTSTLKLNGRVNGNAQTQVSTSGTAQDIEYFYLGTTTAYHSSVDFYIDDVLLSTTGADYPLDEMYVLGYSPTSDGTHSPNPPTSTFADSSSVDISGGNPAYDNLTDFSTTNYVKQYGGTSSNYVRVGFDDAPSGKDPVAVQVVVGQASAAASASNMESDLWDGTTLGSIWTGSSSLGTTLYTKWVMFTQTPSSTAWTETNFNSIQYQAGRSSDYDPNPWFCAVMLEAAYISGGSTTYTKSTNIEALVSKSLIKSSTVLSVVNAPTRLWVDDVSIDPDDWVGRWGLLTHSVDSSLYSAAAEGTISYNLDALIKSTITVSHDLDALIAISVTTTHDLDALIATSVTTTHDLDALIAISVTTTHDLDALIATSVTTTHDLDALISTSVTTAHDLDALISTSVTTTHDLDVLISTTVTTTHDVDALISKLVTTSNDVDALISISSTKYSDVDTLISRLDTKIYYLVSEIVSGAQTLSQTHEIDSLISKTQTVSSDVDARIASEYMALSDIDSLLSKSGISVASSMNASILDTVEAVSSIDSLIEQTVISENLVDALISKAFSAESLIDSLISKSLKSTCDIDSLINKTELKVHSIDSLIEKSYTIDSDIDSLIMKYESVSSDVDANIEGATQIYSQADSLISKTQLQSHQISSLASKSYSEESSLDVLISKAETTSTDIDSLLTKAQIVESAVDVAVGQAGQLFSEIDSLLSKSGNKVQYQIDCLIAITSEETTNIDSLLLASLKASSNIDVLVSQTDTATSSADSLVLKSDSVESSVDSQIASAVSVNSSIDSLLSSVEAVETYLVAEIEEYLIVLPDGDVSNQNWTTEWGETSNLYLSIQDGVDL